MSGDRELDAKIAEKVLEWERVSDDQPYFWPTQEMVKDIRKKQPDAIAVDYFLVPRFSGVTTFAMMVVEEFEKKGFYWHIRHGKGMPEGTPYHFEIGKSNRWYQAYGETVAMAIALTAEKYIKFVESREEEE